jgi:uncharacterized short protein YbdD (DUF466 family)
MTISQREPWNRVTRLWTALRRLFRDDAYERYLAHHAAEHAETTPLTAREFYLREQQRKWSGVTRCC